MKLSLPQKQNVHEKNALLFFGFPLLLNIALYCNVIFSSGQVDWSFSPRVLVQFALSTGLLTILYALVTTLFPKPWITASAVGGVFYVVSLADCFKKNSLGVRISMDDLKMVFNIADLWSPRGGQGAGMAIQPVFWLTFAALTGYVALLWKEKVHLPIGEGTRRAVCAAMATVFCLPFLVPQLAYAVFQPQISGYGEAATHQENSSPLGVVDCLIGSLYYDTTPPQSDLDYNYNTVKAILDGYEPTGSVPASRELPDVIVVMSESYFDLNRVPGLTLNEDIYKNLKRMQQKGTGGSIVVPAYGGGTSATEFEVLSGTSNRAQNNTKAPYNYVGDGKNLWTFQDYFSSLGYHTNFVHPYKSYFYNREKAFTAMGFGRLMFEGDLTITPEPYPRDIHMSDYNLFRQVRELLEENTTTPEFIYTTSVQNHSPYVMLSDSDRKIVTSDQLSDEELENINAYANGIADTDKALGELLDYIDQREKPTALLFFGDHQPLLDGCKRLATKEGEDVYSNLDNLTTEFAMYTNFADTLPSQKCDADGERISAFYLMTVFTRYLDLPQTAYMNFLTDCRESLPVLSARLEVTKGDAATAQEMRDKLVILSYDRLMGRRYSSTERDGEDRASRLYF